MNTIGIINTRLQSLSVAQSLRKEVIVANRDQMEAFERDFLKCRKNLLIKRKHVSTTANKTKVIMSHATKEIFISYNIIK